jgi:hypothetical protein
MTKRHNNGNENLPAVINGQTFDLTIPGGLGFELNPALVNEYDDSDFKAFTVPRSSLPIVSIRGKDHKGRDGRTDADAGGFKIYDSATKKLDQRIPDIEGPLVGVILIDRLGRSYWREGNVDAPNCRSLDAITGQGDPGGHCVSCPLSQFGKDNKRPACGQHMSLLFYDEAMQGCYVYQIGRGGLSHYDAWKTLLTRGAKGHALMSFRVKIDKFFEADAEYPYFRSDFQALGQIEVETFRKLKALRTTLDETMARTIDVVSEDESNGNDIPTGDPGGDLPPGVTPVNERPNKDNDDLPY